MLNLIYKHWASFGGLLALSIITTVLILPNNLSYINSLLWIHLAFLLIHQFEEYIYPGGFKDFFNKNISGKNLITRHPLNNKGIVLVNVLLGWSAYGISAIYGEKYIWLALGLTGITIFNGIMHTLMFIIHKKYNPGFFSSLFLFIPFGFYLLSILLAEISIEEMNSGFTIFLIGTVLIPISIFITNKIKS
jgi:hypothetical protein